MRLVAASAQESGGAQSGGMCVLPRQAGLWLCNGRPSPGLGAHSTLRAPVCACVICSRPGRALPPACALQCSRAWGAQLNPTLQRNNKLRGGGGLLPCRAACGGRAAVLFLQRGGGGGASSRREARPAPRRRLHACERAPALWDIRWGRASKRTNERSQHRHLGAIHTIAAWARRGVLHMPHHDVFSQARA